MPGDTMKVGNVTLTMVKDLPAMRGEPRFMWPTVDPARFLGYKEWQNERGLLDITIGSVLVRSSGKTILIDTGIGKGERPPFRTDRADLVSNLATHGVRPEDVDLVVTTHLHSDHVGWNTIKDGDRWMPTFPRARYLVQQKEWDYFTAPEQREHNVSILENVLPLADAGVLELVSHETAITPDLTYLPTPGHTPDHCSILVQSQGERALVLGDVAHHPIQMSEPEWESNADNDKQLGIQSRKMVVERLEREGMLVLGGHWPFPCMGRIVRLNDRRVFQAARVE